MIGSIDIQKYLQPSQIIDWQNPEILELADQIAATAQTTEEIANFALSVSILISKLTSCTYVLRQDVSKQIEIGCKTPVAV